MNKFPGSLTYVRLSLLLAVTFLLSVIQVHAQCPPDVVTSGLQFPIGLAQTNKGDLLVAEGGTTTPNTGRISIVDQSGHRRTLLAGLPSGINDVLEPSGPAGLFMRGRTLYVAIGVGDIGLPGPFPGTAFANPNPSSPLFSSVLAIHFSASVEKKTSQGFTLTPADHQVLASGQKVTLSSGKEKLTIELVVNILPDFILNPLPTVPANVRFSNPFDLVAVGDQLYVTDGARNLVWRVDIPTGAFSALAEFPPIPNPLFGTIGGPVVEAVPTGIAYSDGQLLVTLFRGFPFPPATSVVQQIDPLTGSYVPLIIGLKTAIDVLPIRGGGDTDYLVLQHTSGVGPPFVPPFSRPGLLLRFDEPGAGPVIIADCLTRPTSMVLDEKNDTLYITEYAGRVVAIPFD